MERRLVLVELTFEPFNLRSEALPVTTPLGSAAGWPGMQRLHLIANGSHNRLTVPVHVGDNDDPAVEILLAQALANDIQCRLLLANHKKRLLATDRIGDHVH